MNRLRKSILLPARYFSYRFRWLKVYYWADKKLFALGNTLVLPVWYYVWLFHFSMKLLGYKALHKIADKAIHTIPYNIRFLAS